MTITTTTPRAQYNGNGATTAFSVPFEFLEAEGVKVIFTDADGVDATWVKDTHYTLTNNTAAATGTVNVKTTPSNYTPANGTKITILRNQPLKQTTSYSNNDPFPAKSHEKALDRLAMEVQTISEKVGRAPVLKETSANSGLTFPEPEANKVLSWNAAGDALANKAVTALEGLYEVVDEDDMASNSDTKLPTQQSVKAYVDAQNSNGPPIVLVATGQSNIENRGSYSWTPESNLYLWDFNGAVDDATDVGAAFSPMDATTMTTAFSWANEIAKKHPTSKVYLLNLGKSSQPISKWMSGGPTPDCYAMVKNNVEAALVVLGLTTIDQMLWWQGESDAGSSTYLSNFNSVMTRFLAETWFPVTTPVSVMGLSPYYSSNALKPINISLFNAVAAYPEVRRFINTGYLPIAYWDASGGAPYIHLTAAGYERAGILAAYADRGAATAIFYEEGTWTPAITFATPGNLSVTYGNQTGTYTRIGRMVFASINLATSAFTHTSASGNFFISGLPYAAANDGASQRAGGGQWQGITKASYTDIVPTVEAGLTVISLRASGSAQTAATITASDMPTGGAVVVRATIVYMI